MYNKLYETVLSRIDPERAHDLGLSMLHLCGRYKRVCRMLSGPVPNDVRLQTSLADLVLPNPIGMAAGFDKNGRSVPALHKLGFGHVEIGTITLFPRKGNPKPRIWRERNGCLRNYMGLPNDGISLVDFDRSCGVLGVSIGEVSGPDEKFDSWMFERLARFAAVQADYVTLNLSCPNVAHAGGSAIDKMRQFREYCKNSRLFLKLGPHLDHMPHARQPFMNTIALKRSVDTALQCGIDGFVLCNTAPSHRHAHGGMSGPCMKRWALKAVRTIFRHTDGKVPIIGVGGVSNADDVLCMLKNGASAVQLLTSFVFGGPRLPARILSGLVEDADKNGWKSVSEIVGAWA